MEDNRQKLQKILGDKYDVQDMIYRGGMGEIYLGLHKRLGAKVAIKIMIQKLTDDPELKKRFHREAQLYANLRHPNIIHIYDFGAEDAFDYMVFPFIEGETLQQKLKREGRLDPKESLSILISVARALDYASENNVIHRDVKPSNIMMERNGNVLITDFGISKDLRDLEITLPGTVLGSPKYMSPDQILGKTVDSRSDQYSLGIIGHEMLAGKYPYNADNPSALFYSHVHEMPELPEDILAAVHPEFPKILGKMVAKEASERYAGFKDLIEDLSMIQLEQTEIKRRPPERGRRKGKAKGGASRTGYILAGAGVVVLLLAGFLGANFFLSSPTVVEPRQASTQTRVADVESGQTSTEHRAAAVTPQPPSKSLTAPSVEPSATVAPHKEKPIEIATDEPAAPGETEPAPVSQPENPPSIASIRQTLMALGRPDKAASFRIGLNRTTYRVGQTITYAIQSDRDCHAVLFDFTTAGELIQLFPNRFTPDSFIKADTLYYIPVEGSFEVTGPAGREAIIGYASPSPLAILGDAYDSGPFPTATDADQETLAEMFRKIEGLRKLPLIRENVDFLISD